MISNLGLVIVDGKLRFCNNNEYKEQVLTCLNCGAKYKFPRIAFIVPQEDKTKPKIAVKNKMCLVVVIFFNFIFFDFYNSTRMAFRYAPFLLVSGLH